MALDLTPDQKTTGKTNFQRVVGRLSQMDRRTFMKGLLAGGTALPLAAAAYFGYNNAAFRERPVKAGIIGAGDEGGVLIGDHNPAYVEFIAYSDIRPYNQKRIFDGEATGPRRGFKHHYGADCERTIRLYENYRDLLANPEIEMVVIALPLNLHAEATIAALNAGKHVLCEKLMGWNVKQCRDMTRAAKANDKLLSIGHQRHYSMLYAHAVEVMNTGQLGDVKHIRALWHRNNTNPTTGSERTDDRPYRDSWRPVIRDDDRRHLESRDLKQYGFKDINELVRWRLYQRTGGGLMAELGSHQLDACSIFLGKKKPLAVHAYGGKHFYRDDREVEDHVYCTYEFPGKDYNPRDHARQRNEQGIPQYSDIVTVAYSSINSNGFEPYGECVMGNRGTMIVEQEQNIYLFGNDGRAMGVTATAGGLGPVVSTSGSAPPEVVRDPVDVGASSLGAGPPSRGYREEMEHLAYLMRTRDGASSRDRDELKPRCDGVAAMADAILALAANAAMRTGQRIEFDPRWFEVPDDPSRDVLPAWDLREPTL